MLLKMSAIQKMWQNCQYCCHRGNVHFGNKYLARLQLFPYLVNYFIVCCVAVSFGVLVPGVYYIHSGHVGFTFVEICPNVCLSLVLPESSLSAMFSVVTAGCFEGTIHPIKQILPTDVPYQAGYLQSTDFLKGIIKYICILHWTP